MMIKGFLISVGPGGVVYCFLISNEDYFKLIHQRRKFVLNGFPKDFRVNAEAHG
jgi:hypothetical protein